MIWIYIIIGIFYLIASALSFVMMVREENNDRESMAVLEAVKGCVYLLGCGVIIYLILNP